MATKAKASKKAAHDDMESTEADEESIRRYEIMAIIDPDLTEAQYKKHYEELKKLLTQHGATVDFEEEWGKRELAYQIKKRKHGFYVIFNFNGDTTQMPELEAQLRITNFVMRHLIVKLPPNYKPQKYELDAELPKIEDRLEQRNERRGTRRPKAGKPRSSGTPTTTELKPAKAPVVPKEASAAEAPAPKKVAAAPKVEPKPDSEKELKKLDKKLEELLSSDGDLNL